MIVFAQTFPSLDAFYAADRRRLHSRERDVGLAWRGRGGATYRAAWVQETGKVYLFRHGAGTINVLTRRFGLGELHAALAGYPRLINPPARSTGSHTAPLTAPRWRPRPDRAGAASGFAFPPPLDAHKRFRADEEDAL